MRDFCSGAYSGASATMRRSMLDPCRGRLGKSAAVARRARSGGMPARACGGGGVRVRGRNDRACLPRAPGGRTSRPCWESVPIRPATAHPRLGRQRAQGCGDHEANNPPNALIAAEQQRGKRRKLLLGYNAGSLQLSPRWSVAKHVQTVTRASLCEPSVRANRASWSRPHRRQRGLSACPGRSRRSPAPRCFLPKTPLRATRPTRGASLAGRRAPGKPRSAPPSSAPGNAASTWAAGMAVRLLGGVAV
jgi:hypothetical protein